MRNKKQLTYEEEVNVLAFIQYCQGHSTKGDCRAHMYDIYKLFKNDGRTAAVCSCLDGDTAKKVDNFISSYTFSDETRLTDKFRQLLPHLALIDQSAKEPLEEKSNVELDKIDLSKLTIKVDESLFDKEAQTRVEHGKAKKPPVKAVRKKRTTKKK